MKCQKCGKNEVNFHYTTNINGSVADTHLCSQCAIESGYDMEKMLDLGNFFEAFMPVHNRINGFMPMMIPMIQAGTLFPFAVQPRTGLIEQGTVCDCGCGAAKEMSVEVDEDMKMRRELNAQMRDAVEKEEFEKAAELRDKIKELELGRSMKCDSETSSQDSPTAQ